MDATPVIDLGRAAELALIGEADLAKACGPERIDLRTFNGWGGFDRDVTVKPCGRKPRRE
jgi:hypothetical protein